VTNTWGVTTDSDSNSDSTSGLESHPSSLYDGPSPFPFGLHNTAASYQALLQDLASHVRKIPLTGAQEGLVLTVRSQDYIVHWPGSISEDGNTRLVDATIVLPFQEGDSSRDAEASTKILNRSNSTEIGTNDVAIHAWEVFIGRSSQSPLIPPEQPDVRSSDESESNISPDTKGDNSEAKSQRQVRERKNRLKQGLQRWAKQCKEA
jgi:hypothetical protein